MIGAGGHRCPVARDLGESVRARGGGGGAGDRDAAPARVAGADRALHGRARDLRRARPARLRMVLPQGRLHQCRHRHHRRQRREPARRRDALLAMLRASGRLPEAMPLDPFKGARVCRAPPGARRLAGPGFCLVGDAAGLARDLSGEGIGPAIRSGILAAAADTRLLREGGSLDAYARRGGGALRAGEPAWIGRQLGRLPEALARLAVRVVLGSDRAAAPRGLRLDLRHEGGDLMRRSEAGRRGHLVPLRPVQRVLCALPRPAAWSYTCAYYRDPDGEARAGSGGQAGSGVPQAPAPGRRDPARHRLRMGEPRHLGGPALWCSLSRGDAVARPGGVRRRAHRAGGAHRALPGGIPRLPRPAHGRTLRQDRRHRRHRARGHRQLSGLLRARAGMLNDGGYYLNHGITHEFHWKPTTQTDFLYRHVFPNGELARAHPDHDRAGARGLGDRGRRGAAAPLRSDLPRVGGAARGAQADEARALVGERIYRIWRLYLTCSSVAFQEGHIGLYQVLMRKQWGRYAGVADHPRRDLR